MENSDVIPPWISYPDYPPHDMFWRQAGEYYLAYIWQPFWGKLTEHEKTLYLVKWPMPTEWIDFYKFQEWLNSIDDETLE